METPKEPALLMNKSWTEIRESFLKGEPYWQIFERALPRLDKVKEEEALSIAMDEDNIKAIRAQQDKANTTSLLSVLGIGNGLNLQGSRIEVKDINGNEFIVRKDDNYKLWVLGKHEPELKAGDNLTRLYLALDPRFATDAFFAFVRELAASRVLSGIQLCLNIEETQLPKISNNAVVVYVNNTHQSERQSLIDKILSAYKKAKIEKPEYFNFTAEQVNGILSSYFASYRLFLDSNLSFVEMDRGTPSYDAGGRQLIDDALGVSFGTDYRDKIALLKSRETTGVVWRPDSKNLLNNIQSLSDGTVIASIRRLRMPALIERGKYFVETVNGQKKLIKS